MGNKKTGIVLLAEAAGGVMRHVIDLYKGLRTRGWRVQMILSPLRIESRYQEELAQVDQADVHYVEMRRAPHRTDWSAYHKVAGILKEASEDTILHAHSTKAGMLGSLLQPMVRAAVFTPHAYRGVDPNSTHISRAFLRLVERTYSKNYDRILAVAPAEMEYARTLGIREEALRCIPNGLDTSHIDFLKVFERRRRVGNPLCLGFVGRLVYQKNPVLFLEVLAEVVARGREARAVIVGDGPMKSEMLQSAQRLGVTKRVEWRGAIPATESLREMDVMVHTSVYEALPYTLIEACADLLPIVATDNYGSEAVLGPLLPKNIAAAPEAGEIASILTSIFDDDSLRIGQLGSLAAIAREYSTDTMVSKIAAEYESLLSV